MSSNPFFALFKHSIIYGIGQVSVSATAFILMPVFTNPQYLSVKEYGIWQILNITMTVLVIILNMGMTTTLFRFYYEEEDAKKRLKVSNTIVWFLFSIATLVLLITFFIIDPYLLSDFGIDYTIQSYFSWIVLAATFQAINVVMLNIFRAEEKPWRYISFQLIQFLMLLFFLSLFLLKYKWQLRGMVNGYVMAFGVTFILLLLSYRAKLRIYVDFVLLKRMLLFGLPLAATQLGGWVLSVFDRYLLGFQLNYSAAAVYSVGYQFGMVVNLIVIMPFSAAWGPFMFKVFKRNDARTVYARTLTYISLASLYTAFIVSTFSEEILMLFTNSPEYLEAQVIISLVAYSYVFYGMYYVFTTGLNVTNRTYYFVFIILVASVFNISANYLLIPRLGILAPAIITMGSFSLLAFLTYYYSHKFYKIPFEFGRIILMFAVFVTTGIMGHFWKSDRILVTLGLKSFIILLPVLVLYLLKFFKLEEMEFIKEKVFNRFHG
jgi:O-antigen/teichoic acid export membrane protein